MTGLAGLLAAGSVLFSGMACGAQQLPEAPSAARRAGDNGFRGVNRTPWFLGQYRAPRMEDTYLKSVDQVPVRDGKLKLTLQDAILMAIKNNFDVEIQRYDLDFAAADLLRARGGGVLRGVSTTVAELPSGEGGPGAPLLTAIGGYSPVLQLPSSAADLATTTQSSSDLSILGQSPFSSGPALPQFDPSVVTNISLAQQYYPQSNAFATGNNFFSSHTTAGSLTYNQGLSLGTQISASITGSRLNQSSARVNLNPFITGTLSLSITQPLLQGFGPGVNRRFIHIAQNEKNIARDVFEQQLISTVSDTTRLYWDLVSLQEDLKVKQEYMEAAQRLYKDTKNQVELGTQAPVDLTSAAAQVASSRQAYINAEGLVLQQELLLKEVLTHNGISDGTLAAARIEAATKIPAPALEDAPSLENLLSTAMNQRPDVALAGEQIATAKTALKGSHNQMLPELNLVASMQNNGAAGTPATPSGTSTAAPANLVGGYGSALSQMFQRSYPDYMVGAELRIPVHNRIAKSDYVRDELQFRQSEVRLQQLRSRVRIQVGDAYIALQQAKESYRAAADARVLQAQALDVEQAKFEAGVATAYELIQYQSNFAAAESAEVAARGIYAKSRTALERAAGTILDDNSVAVDEAYANGGNAGH
ncbi:TolC family protein [Terriglobus tenax]|uniref:TolC family protein n=1 Tax=Terriglobus tenax TaxID=1111115 RepID=UPI0021E0FAA7|nr:TolC family protein [Terriglobus tenax]